MRVISVEERWSETVGKLPGNKEAISHALAVVYVLVVNAKIVRTCRSSSSKDSFLVHLYLAMHGPLNL